MELLLNGHCSIPEKMFTIELSSIGPIIKGENGMS